MSRETIALIALIALLIFAMISICVLFIIPNLSSDMKTVTGTLELQPYPQISEDVPFVMVWTVRSPGITGRTYYLTVNYTLVDSIDELNTILYATDPTAEPLEGYDTVVVKGEFYTMTKWDDETIEYNMVETEEMRK